MEKIAVVGIGKLGLCFALNLERAGFNVLGIDIDENYVDSINKKTLKSDEPLVEQYLRQSKKILAVADISALSDFDAELIYIMVATPSTAEGGYDHSQIERVLHEITNLEKPEKTRHLIIGCTVMPGYCNSISEKMQQFNYTVNYNPEFIAQGTIITNQQYPDQILIGEAVPDAGNKIESVCKKICRNEPVICRMDTLSAEICKLATNCFLTMKISFANSIGDLAKTAGADEKKILTAIGTDSRIGNKYLQYGFGFGGPCFPRDNRALQQYAEQINIKLPLSVATDEINNDHLRFQLKEWMNNYSPDEEIVFEGVSYKNGSPLIEESQQLKLAVALAKNNRKVIIVDNKNVIEQVRNQFGDLFIYKIRA